MNLRFLGLFAILTLVLGVFCYSSTNQSFAQSPAPANQTSTTNSTTSEPVQNKTAMEKSWDDRARTQEKNKEFTQSIQAKIQEELEKIKSERAKALEKQKSAMERTDRQSKRINEKAEKERQKNLQAEQEKLKQFKGTTFTPNPRYSTTTPSNEKKLSGEQIQSKFEKVQQQIQDEKTANQQIPEYMKQLIKERQQAIEKSRQEKSQTVDVEEQRKNPDKIRDEKEQKRLALEKELKAQEGAKKIQKEALEKIQQEKEKALGKTKAKQG